MTRAQLIRSSESRALVPMHGSPQGSHWAPDVVQEEGNSVRYSALFRRYKRPILTILCGCVLMSLLVTWIMPPRFKAKAVLEVLTANQDYLNNKDVNPTVSSSTPENYVETQTRLLTSDGLMDRVTTALLANAKNYVKPESEFKKLGEQLHVFQPPKVVLAADIGKTLSNLQVKPLGQSSLISVIVSGPSAQLAADAANMVATQHILALQEGRTNMANETEDFLSLQLSAMRKKLKQSDDDLQAYARSSGLIISAGSDRDSVGAEKLREVQADLERAEADRTEKQAQMELIGSGPADSLPKVLDDGSLKESKGRLADLRRQLADLSSLYTPNHYKVKEVQSQIADLEDQIKQNSSMIVSRIRNDYKAAVRREALQREQYESQINLVKDQSAKEVNYNLLKRDADANRDSYQGMLQKIHEAHVVAALNASNIHIVDRAKAAKHPDQPNLPVNVAIGTLLGCVLAMLYVLLRERSDGSIRSAGQVMRSLQLPELAVVPSAKRDIRTQIVSAQRSGILGGIFTRQIQSSDAERSKDLVANWRNTGSVVAESYRSAVASIILWGRDSTAQHKVLVVTSAHSSAGKTTSVLNLGLGLVESGRRVLLIDGDLRLPRLGQIFGLEQASGLTNILAEQLHPEIAGELIRQTGLPGLDVLPSGPRFMNVTELLHSEGLPELIEQLRDDYDVILVDTPPALPLTDARLLAQHADGVIIVVRAGTTTIDQTLNIQQSFAQDGSHIFGTILNHWDAGAEDPAYMGSYMKYASAPGMVAAAASPRMSSPPTTRRTTKKRTASASD